MGMTRLPRHGGCRPAPNSFAWRGVRHAAPAFRPALDADAIRRAERARIARALHDELLQSAQCLSLQVQAGIDALPTDHPVRQSLSAALAHADRLMAQTQDAIRGLRAQEPAQDLAQALREALQAAIKLAHPVSLSIGCTGAARPLKPSVWAELFCIAREAALNALRHAQAGAISITIGYACGGLSLRVHDDGRGLPPKLLRPRCPSRHWGLRGMRERAALIGAALHLQPAVGGGTELLVCLPAQRAYRVVGRAPTAHDCSPDNQRLAGHD